MNVDEEDERRIYMRKNNCMIESEALKKPSFATIMTLFSSVSVFTDDMIPIEEVLEGIKHALTEE